MSRAAIIVAAGLAIATSPAHAADRKLVKQLGPLIGKRCTASRDQLGEISAGRLVDALLSSIVVTFDSPALLVGQSGSMLAPVIMDAAPGDNREAYLLVGGTVRGWTAPTAPGAGNFLPLAHGGVEVRARDGRTLGEADTTAVLADILDRNDAHYRFVCMVPADTASPPADGNGVARLLIVKEPTDLAIPKLTDRPFAELAYLRDEESGSDTYSFYGTLGLATDDRTIGRRAYEARRGNTMLRIRPLAFAQLEYEKASDAASAKVDNLNFGAELGGVLQTRGARTSNQFWALSVRYLTDTRFDSAGWSAVAKWTPYFGVPGNIVPYVLGKGVELQWRLTGVADHAGFSDIGRKTELVGAPHYTRLGLDATADLRLKLGDTNILSLGGTYAWRENLERGLGNATRSTLRLTFSPSDNFSVGLGYDRGRNIDTLEYSRTVKLTLGIRK